MENEIDNLNFQDDEESEEDNPDYNPSDPNSFPKIKKKKQYILSEKEKKKIKEAIEQMKVNQVQPQKSVGKVFTGPGFASNPPKIIYKDFEVGKKMSITIDITNISYSFNSFHLQPWDDDIIDFFEIDYRPFGRIPAGISKKMTLHFTPWVNKDYKSNWKLLSETGLCEIPIECYCKKCLISFESETINYGEVILGQEIPKDLIVKNSGALNCKFTMVDKDYELLTNKEDDDDRESENEWEPSYKDFTDRKIILHKFDFVNANDNISWGVVDVIKKRKVEKYKEELIAQEIDKLEQAKKEKEELDKQTNPKGKAVKPPKKPNKNDKEPEIEWINGLPPESMSEIETKIEEYTNNFKIESEDDIKEISDEVEKIREGNTRWYTLKQLIFPLHGQFEPYSTKNVSIILDAKYIGNFTLVAFVKIEYKEQIEYKQFNISFSVVDLPIYSEKKIYELDYIVYDHIFREKIVLVNKSNMPYKLQISHHKDWKEYIELNPSLGYVQANSTFDIWLKLKVGKNISNLISFFKANNKPDTNEYNLPLKIVLNNIKIPLITILHLFVTNDNVVISEKMWDFGKRPIDEATKAIVSLENKSELPMKYGFIMLPTSFLVRTNIDNWLSNEKIFVNIIYNPQNNFVGHREGDLFCRVVTAGLTCQQIKIKYHIELVAPEIEIKPKKIRFQALPEGEKEELRWTICNKNDTKAFDCEFLMPPACISGWTIMPKVFTIEPKDFTTCVIRFNSEFREYGPFSYEEVEKELGIKLSDGWEQLEKDIEIEGNENELLEDKIKQEVDNTWNNIGDGGDKKKKGGANVKEVKKEVKKPPEPKKDKKALEEEERKKKEDEERLIKEIEDKKLERVTTFNKEKELLHFGAENVFKDIEGDRSSHWRFVIPMFYRNHLTNSEKETTNQNAIQLKTCYWEVQTTCIEKQWIFDKFEMNFGEVSVQTGKTMNLVCTNTGNKTAKLKMKPLLISNCFRIVNAIRDIPPGESFNFIVEFFPVKDLPYFEDFTVYTSDIQSTVHWKGIGVKPEVETSVSDGWLFLGNSVMNNTLEKSFEIISKSNFKINYEIKSVKTGKKNKTGLKPFCYVPYCGEIEPNGRVEIKITFNGDHQDFENYFDFILIDVPNQKVENKILVSAYCWSRQVYWKELTDISYPDEEFMNKMIEQDTFVDCLKWKSNSLSSNNEKIVLVFTSEHTLGEKADDKLKERCFKRKIVIGNCKWNDNKLEKNGAYEVLLGKDDQYFSCDNPKGGVNGGSEVIITFSFKKPNPDPIVKDIECLKNVGMWVTAKAEVKISGGFVQPGMQDAVSFEVWLKAYIEQI